MLRLIAGLDDPTDGTIHIGDQCVSAPGRTVPPERRPVNMVFQDFALWPHMKVGEIIRFGMKYRKVPKSDWAGRSAQLLDMLELKGLEDRCPRQLSGGQQQRVAIARALATDPRLLLLDEPLSNLDSQLRLQMRDELSTLLRRVGTTAMYVTHDLQEALTLGDRLVIMRHGRIEQMGTAEEIFTQPATPWVAGLVGFSNQVRVQVETNSNGRVTVRQGERTLEVASGNAELNFGGEATLMSQPKALTVTTGNGCTSNCMSATVSSCHFEGLGWRLRCDASGQVITVHSDRAVTEGETVCIEVPPERARVFAEAAPML